MVWGLFPKTFPNVFPKGCGVNGVLWMLSHSGHIHPKTLRPRSKEAVTIEIMARDLMCGKRIYDKLKNQARQQLALMNKCRMRKTGGKVVANQPFYVQFLNR